MVPKKQPAPEGVSHLTLVEVANLSDRASVAVAVRCALRMQEHFRLPEDLEDRIACQRIWDAAMDRAIAFVRGGYDSGEGLEELVRAAYVMAEETAECTMYAGYSAGHAIQTLAHVLAAQERDGLRGLQVVASTFGACRVLIQRCQPSGWELVMATLRSELEVARALPREEGLGAPLDPSEAGPLGAFWPLGRPPEF